MNRTSAELVNSQAMVPSLTEILLLRYCDLSEETVQERCFKRVTRWLKQDAIWETSGGMAHRRRYSQS
jgi:hypothetical protein